MRTVVSSILVCAVVGASGRDPLASRAARSESGRPVVHNSCGARELIEVTDTASLLANIQRDHVEIVMASGRYALSACLSGVDEWSAAACGQLEQGQCSVLRSTLELPVGGHRVPFGSGAEVPACDAIPATRTIDGAVIDCSALPASAQEFSCVVAGRQSTIADLTICNGTPPVPLAAGELGAHRNGIGIVAGKDAVVEGVRIVNSRRGVLVMAESDQVSRGEVLRSLIEGTELAGVAFATRAADDSTPPRRTTRALVEGHLESTRITRAGLHPILVEYGFGGGQDNHSTATLVDNVVDASNQFGVSIIAATAGTSNNSADVSVRGGRLDGNTGVRIQSGPPTSAGNSVRAVVEHVDFGPNMRAVDVSLLGEETAVELLFDHNRYEGAGPGTFRVVLNGRSSLRVLGSAQGLATRNYNFDISNIAGYLTDLGLMAGSGR